MAERPPARRLHPRDQRVADLLHVEAGGRPQPPPGRGQQPEARGDAGSGEWDAELRRSVLTSDDLAEHVVTSLDVENISKNVCLSLI